MLLHCISRARQHMINLGYGQLRVEWIKAHLAAEVAVSQGLCPAEWLANAIADSLADKAAELMQLPPGGVVPWRVAARLSPG